MLLRNRAELFPGTPIVSLAVDQRLVADLHPAPGLTGVWGEINFKSNLHLALELHPGTKRVVMIQGTSEIDKDVGNSSAGGFSRIRIQIESSDILPA